MNHYSSTSKSTELALAKRGYSIFQMTINAVDGLNDNRTMHMVLRPTTTTFPTFPLFTGYG